MLRLLSLILLLAGAAIVALGGWLYMGHDLPSGWLGSQDTVLERKVLEPEAERTPSAIIEEEVAEAATPEAVFEAIEPMEDIEIAPSAAPEPKPTAPKSSGTTTRSLSVEDEALAAPQSVEAPGASEPVFTTQAMPPEAVAAPAPPPPSIEEQLFSVPIAYETPAKASFNQPFIVTLSINAQDGAETATGGLSGSTTTNIEEAVVQVTDQVKANLFGEAFTITTKSPDIQKLSKSTESRWRWQVTPTKTGPQELTFEIFAIHADDVSELMRTFDDTVTVEVSRIGQAMFLAQKYDPIMMILAGLGSLLAGLFGAARFFRGS